jgi:hypothetical protein
MSIKKTKTNQPTYQKKKTNQHINMEIHTSLYICMVAGRVYIHTVPRSRGGSKGGLGAPAPPNFLISMLITVAKT